jgi:hypothetical protein
MAAMAALVGSLEPYSYVVGFFFVTAASAATFHLFIVEGWPSVGLRIIEVLFFWMGLFSLAVMFFFNAPRDMKGLVVIALVTIGLIVGPLAYAYHRRHAWIFEPA